MNYLIIYSHPNPKSFNHAIMETLQKTLFSRGHDVRVRDLYKVKFDPVLSAKDLQFFARQRVASDIKREQDHVRWADTLIFIFPVWWNSLPAIARGYVDRVLSVNFAYTETGKGLLQGKKVVTICTLNAPKEVCEKGGIFKAMNVAIGECLSSFCGMTLLGQKYFNSVASSSDAERQRMLDEVAELGQTLI